MFPTATPGAGGHAGEACEAAIRAAGGIDLQVLGIGSNGHILFNEPGPAFSSRTRGDAGRADAAGQRARHPRVTVVLDRHAAAVL